MEHLISLHDLTVEDLNPFSNLRKNLKGSKKKVYLTTCSKANSWYDFYKVIHQDPCIF